ncbi:MAG: hypothetical protein GY742_09605, partial [Hyphomicrobiales bacterium]|nr:hypothetical protein [Hyphomicrobiales bacterium]
MSMEPNDLGRSFIRGCKKSLFRGLNSTIVAGCAVFLWLQAGFAQVVPVVTDNQVASVGAATCAQQLNNYISGLDNDGLNKEYAEIGLASAAILAHQIEVGANVAGLGTEEGGRLIPWLDPVSTTASIVAIEAGIIAQGVALAASEVQLGLEAAALVAMAVGVDLQIDANEATQVQNNLPNCNSTFTGTVTVDAGGIDVTGNSQITGDLGINGDFIAARAEFVQGLSVFDGQLTLGNADLDSFFAGITIGGGAFAGAGTGGEDSYTGDVDAIAIGNGSSASNAGGIAFGLRANSGAASAVAIGTDSSASGASSVAFGVTSSATQENAFALGTSAAATGVSSLAFGNNAASSGLNAIAIGTRSVASA